MEGMDRPTINRLATGAGGSITLGGTRYLVSQPTDQDNAALATELHKIAARQRQGKLLKLTKELGGFAAAREFLDATEPAAVFDSGDAKADARAYHRMTSTAEGCRCLAWLLCRKAHAELPPDHFDGVITERNAAALALDLMRESGMLALNPNSDGGTGLSPAAKTAAASATT